MGTRKPNYVEDFEGPPRKVKLSAFQISSTTVTNLQFAQFVSETGYKTVAECEGWSYVFYAQIDAPDVRQKSPAHLSWWKQVYGASWRFPHGPESSLSGIEDHPVCHITWYDAKAFCDHVGARLPTEAEWEVAARGGMVGKKFPWGNELTPNGEYRCNVWQGNFPHSNSAEDGYHFTAPSKSFEPNAFGVFNAVGNVWEWCSDWFGKPDPSRALPATDPRGPPTGDRRVTKGGSFLCHASYCSRYHVHSRTGNTPDSSTSNLGFRVAASLDQTTQQFGSM